MGQQSTPLNPSYAGKIIQDDANERIVIYDTSSPILARMVIGRLPDGSYGVVISQPGFDVFSLFS